MKLLVNLVIIFIMLAGGVVALACLKTRSYEDSAPTSTSNDLNEKKPYDVTGNKEKGEITHEEDKSTQSEGLRCIISSAPYFDKASSLGSLCIANHKDNEGYLLQVEITDDETGEIMYISPLLNADEKVQEDYLKDQTYEKGEYPATATFYFYKAEDQSFYYAIPFQINVHIGG